MRRTLFLVLLVALVAFGLYRWQRLNSAAGKGGPGAKNYTPAESPRIDPKDVQILTALDAEYTRIVAAVVPSVVSVNSSRNVRVQDPFEFLRGKRLPRAEQSLGSGVIVSKEGHIISNHHVVAGMEKIEVQLTDGRRLPAQIIGTDEGTDIAILKIAAPNLVPLPLGDSEAVRAGQIVFAVGNPFGFQETVTQGIVSAKGRRAVADSGIEFLQTDTAVNKGNSGGPLLNVRGEIIGINSAIYSTSSEITWLGISFAIPSNVARRALESVLKTGRVVRGYLGVTMLGLTPEIARELGLPDTNGALVLEVLPGSPADRAGFRPRDILRRFNGRPITDIYDLRERVAEAGIGVTVTIGILREANEQTLTAEIGEAPAPAK